MGIDLSRTTMANWLIRCAEEYFAPLVEQIREDLAKRDCKFRKKGMTVPEERHASPLQTA